MYLYTHPGIICIERSIGNPNSIDLDLNIFFFNISRAATITYIDI